MKFRYWFRRGSASASAPPPVKDIEPDWKKRLVGLMQDIESDVKARRAVERATCDSRRALRQLGMVAIRCQTTADQLQRDLRATPVRTSLRFLTEYAPEVTWTSTGQLQRPILIERARTEMSDGWWRPS